MIRCNTHGDITIAQILTRINACYTKTEDAAKFETKANMYDKSTQDGYWARAGYSYTKSEADAKYDAKYYYKWGTFIATQSRIQICFGSCKSDGYTNFPRSFRSTPVIVASDNDSGPDAIGIRHYYCSASRMATKSLDKAGTSRYIAIGGSR